MGLLKKKGEITAKELGVALYNSMVDSYKRWSLELQKDIEFETLNNEEKVSFEWELIFLGMFGIINICENIIKDKKVLNRVLDSFHEIFKRKLIEDGYREDLKDFVSLLNQRYTQYKNALSKTDKAGPLFHLGKIAFQNLFPKLDPDIRVVYKLSVLFNGQGMKSRIIIDSFTITG